MLVSDGLFTGSIPQLYNQLMVPMLFDAYAADMAAQIATLNPTDILETAAGSGALTRAVAARLPKTAKITATDLNQPMLDVAATLSPNDPRITWAACDATNLPFPHATFDAVICQFGVMFFPDKPMAFAEAARVLRKGGTFLFNVWDRIAANDFVATATDVLAARFPENPPVSKPSPTPPPPPRRWMPPWPIAKAPPCGPKSSRAIQMALAPPPKRWPQRWKNASAPARLTAK
jgi:SAM-dependent methyltransferase